MIDLQFPFTLGMDFSGIIKQVGEGVSNSDFKQGDEVYGQAGVINEGSGAFVEMALAKTESVANKPEAKPCRVSLTNRYHIRLIL